MPVVSRTRRIAVMGFRSVGKSSLTLQFVNGQFADAYNPTIEQTLTKSISLGTVKYVLNLVDTAGQDESNVLPETYVMNVDGYVLVYSVNSHKSFEVVKVIREKVLDRTGNPNTPMVLVGNKSDLNEERVVSRAEGEKTAKEWRVPFCESTAKVNSDANSVFEAIVSQIERSNNNEPSAPAGQQKRESRCVVS